MKENKCYYCESKAEYWDVIPNKVISVCKKHFRSNSEASS